MLLSNSTLVPLSGRIQVRPHFVELQPYSTQQKMMLSIAFYSSSSWINSSWILVNPICLILSGLSNELTPRAYFGPPSGVNAAKTNTG